MTDQPYPLIVVMAQFIFTYGLVPLVIYQVFSRLIPKNACSRGFLLAASLGMGPICISWLITMSFLAFPGQPHLYYIIFINAIFIIPFIILQKQLLCLPELIKTAEKELKNTFSSDSTLSFILLLGLGLVFFAFFLSIYLPYSENDALEYAMLAKIMYTHSSARMYPIFDGTQFGGFIAPFTHPLGYTSLYVWSYLIKGSAETFGLIRIVAPFYALCTYFLILVLLFKTNKRWAIFAALLYIATPLFYAGIIRHQIETIRLFTFFNLFMFIPALLQLEKWRSIIIGGILMGMSLYCHSFSILSIPIFGFVYWLCSKEPLTARINKIVCIIAFGCLFVVPRYFINFHETGHLIQDGTAVRAVLALHFKDVYEVTHHISSFSTKWIHGFFRLFYRFIDFGITYFLLIISLFLITPKIIKALRFEKLNGDNRSYDPLIISGLVLFCFFGMITLSILIGDNNFIASARYMMSMQPFAAIVSGLTLVQLLQYFRSRHAGLSLMVSLGVFALAFIYPLNNMANYKLSPGTLFDDDFAKAKHSQRTYRALHYIQKNTPESASILSFRNAETAYYAKRNYVYHTDPKLVDFYQARDADSAFQQLISLGIHYILTPEYPLAYIDQSHLVDIIGNPEYSDLIYQDGSVKIFRLHPSKTVTLKTRVVTNDYPDQFRQNKILKHYLNSTKAAFSFLSLNLQPMDIKITETPFNTNHPTIGILSKSFPLERNQLYQMKIKPKGKGNIRYCLINLSLPVKDRFNLFNQTLLSENNQTYSVQFKSINESPVNLLSVDLMGAGEFKIEQFELFKIKSNHEESLHRLALKSLLIDKGWQISNGVSQLHHYYYRLKKLLGYRNNALYNFDVDWQAKSEDGYVKLSISPLDSLQYFIKFPALNPENNQSVDYSIKGIGQAVLEFTSKRKNQSANAKPIVKAMPVSLSSQFETINMLSLIQKAFNPVDNENATYQIRLKYRKPKTAEAGLVAIKTPV